MAAIGLVIPEKVFVKLLDDRQWTPCDEYSLQWHCVPGRYYWDTSITEGGTFWGLFGLVNSIA